MPDTTLFLKAMGIGAAIAAPMGPMSLLCMRTTLTHGWRHGLAIGGGIAIGDALYGVVAALGLAGLSAFLLAYALPLNLVAGLFLIWLGVKALRADPAAATARNIAEGGVGRDFITAIMLTLTNPPTILTFAAIFTALVPPEGAGTGAALATVAGVFAGSLVWWLLVILIVSLVRHALGVKARRWIDLVSGLALAGLGMASLWRALVPFL